METCKKISKKIVKWKIISPDIDKRPSEITPSYSPKRLKELPCDVQHVTYKGTKWIILVGLFLGKPYELFMGKSADLAVPLKYKIGRIVKTGKGKYHLYSDADEILIKDIIGTSDDDQCAYITRLISMCLRHGILPQYVCDQLSKDGSVVDINNILARILRKYVKSNKEVCQRCGSDSIVYEEKCKKCLACSWMGCG